MARPTNAELVGKYQSKIRASKKFRQDEGLDELWQRLVRLYRGKHYEYFSNEDRLLVNISFSTVNVIAPSVAVNHPKITVNSTKDDSAAQAIIAESVVNYWWRHYKVQPQFRRAVKDFLITGHGWLKCGYYYVEEERVGTDAEISDESVEGNDIQPTTVIVEDRPFVERVSPFDVFVDPDATSMDDIGWIAQRIRRPIKDVKNDKRYNSAARSYVQPTSWKKMAVDGAEQEMYDKDEQYVEVWEFYDLRKGTLSVFADACEHFLVSPQKMPYAFGHPFVMLRNYDVPDEFYPMGDLEAIEPLQRELNETRTQMMNHRKRYARKYMYDESRFDNDGRAALESDDDNILVPVKGDGPLDNAVVPMPAVITPPEFYNQSALIRDDISLVSAVSEYQAGQMPEIRRTATEASIIADAGNARAADKLAIIELSIAEIARRMVQLAQQFMTGEQVIRIVGQNGEPMWLKFDSDYIAGEFDFEVEGGSTQPNNESFRRQSAIQLMDAMAPFLQMGVIDPKAVAAHILQFGFGIKSPERFFAAPPEQMPQDPMAEQMPPEGGMPPEQGGLPPELMAMLGGGGGDMMGGMQPPDIQSAMGMLG